MVSCCYLACATIETKQFFVVALIVTSNTLGLIYCLSLQRIRLQAVNNYTAIPSRTTDEIARNSIKFESFFCLSIVETGSLIYGRIFHQKADPLPVCRFCFLMKQNEFFASRKKRVFRLITKLVCITKMFI